MLLSELKTPLQRDGWVYEEKYDEFAATLLASHAVATLEARTHDSLELPDAPQ